MTGPEDQFRSALRQRGIVPPDALIADGRIHRCDAEGKNGKGDAAYLLHLDGVPAGGLENHRDGRGWESWKFDAGRPLSFAETNAVRAKIEAAKQQREAEIERSRAEARERARQLWKSGTPGANHPYLRRKNVQAFGVRVGNGLLFVPMLNAAGELCSVQTIDANGEKRFLAGGQKQGCYHAIGKPNGRICIAEGYATGATIHQATGHAVAVAFDCGNLEPVARALRAKYPDLQITVCADNDVDTSDNPGVTKATEAAAAVGGLVAVPEFGQDRPTGCTDFNDLAALHGPEAVKRALERAQTPEVSEGQSASPNATAADLEVAFRRGDAVVPEAVRWIWSGWLAAGKFQLIAGQPGTGKTTIALAFAATITSGGRWPDGSRAEIGDVLIWSGEDDPADTLAPRLIAMGADMTRVHFVDGMYQSGELRPFDPATDVAALAHKASELQNVRLLIVDPVVSAVRGDSHKNAETRRGLQPLVTLAARLGCAVLGVSHFSKGTAGREPVDRVTGSLAFAALARVVMVAAKLKAENDERAKRMLARAKSNLGPDGGGFRYDLQQIELPSHSSICASQVLWGAGMEGTARELLAQAEAEDDPSERGAIDEAVTFLQTELADGALPAKYVRAAAESAGHSWATVRRAKDRLGIRPEKVAMHGGWSWSLPSKVLKISEDAQGLGLGTFDDPVEHVRGGPGEDVQVQHEDAQPKSVSTFGEVEHLRADDEPRERF